jgi:hypothetical protein
MEVRDATLRRGAHRQYSNDTRRRRNDVAARDGQDNRVRDDLARRRLAIAPWNERGKHLVQRNRDSEGER